MLKYSVGPWTKELKFRALQQNCSASCSNLTVQNNNNNDFNFNIIKSYDLQCQSFNENQSFNSSFSSNSNTLFDFISKNKNVKRSSSSISNVAQSFKNKITKTWYFYKN